MKTSPFKPTILVVDDEPSIREFLQIMLKREKMNVEIAENGKVAFEKFQNGNFDLVISDLQMPEMGGLELLGKIRSKDPNALVMMVTAFGSTETAVEAMKLGAFDISLSPLKLTTLKCAFKRRSKIAY